MSCALDDEVAEIGCVSTHKEAAFEPRNLAAADENRNAEQRYAQHDRYIDADEMAADIDTIGRNKAGHPKNYEDIVDATADQIADRDVTLLPDRRYDRGHEFGRRGTDGNDRQADEGVRYIPETRQSDRALAEPVGAHNTDNENNRAQQQTGCHRPFNDSP